MARCKDCYHYEICAKQSRMVQIDEHTWDTYEEVLEGVEKLCEHFIADVVPKSETELAKDIFTDIEKIINRYCKDYKYTIADVLLDIAEAKKKYMEGGE